MKEIEKYVSDMQVRNIQYFPTDYDRAVSRAGANAVQDL